MNTYNSSGSDAAGALSGLFGGIFLCYFAFIILIIVVSIWVMYKITAKTGNSGWLALLVLVPFGSLGLWLFLAFSDWPVLRENRDLKARFGGGMPGYIPPNGGYVPPVPGYAPPVQQYAPAPPAYAPPAAPAEPSVTPTAPTAPVDPYAPPAPPTAPIEYSHPAPQAEPYAPPVPPSEPPAEQ
jgi:hypothetical protein